MRSVRLEFFALLIASAMLAGCAAKKEDPGGTNGTADSTATKATAKGKETDKAVPVEVTVIAAGHISSFILTTSSIETEEAVDVFPQVTGIAVKLNAEEGEYVRKGDVLLEIDDREYRLAEQSARVNYDRQQNSFDRSKSMFEKNLTSADEFDIARFNLEQARIDWEKAKLTLDYCKIRAHISGYISQRTCKLGDRLLTSSKVYSLVNSDLLLAKIYLTEKDAMRARVGQRAEIYSDAIPGKTFDGRVSIVSPVVDPTSGMVRVTVRLEDKEHLVKPGMFVNVHLITDTRQQAALIPKKAVIYDDNRQFIYVVRNDTLAIKVPLQAGYSDRDHIEAVGGVSVGDTLIVVGQSGMKDSARVKIADAKS